MDRRGQSPIRKRAYTGHTTLCSRFQYIYIYIYIIMPIVAPVVSSEEQISCSVCVDRVEARVLKSRWINEIIGRRFSSLCALLHAYPPIASRFTRFMEY